MPLLLWLKAPLERPLRNVPRKPGNGPPPPPPPRPLLGKSREKGADFLRKFDERRGRSLLRRLLRLRDLLELLLRVLRSRLRCLTSDDFDERSFDSSDRLRLRERLLLFLVDLDDL